MPADGFGIGIYDDRVNKLFYPGYIELDEILEECYDDLEDENMIAGYCFHHDNEIVVGNLNTEYSKYIKNIVHPFMAKQ